MIITLKGCTATAFIGGLNFFKVSKGTVSGADVTISTSTINKDEATSTSAREIATVALKSNYENLVVTVTMGGTTVNWFADGKVTIPANIEVTGDIKISASATAVSGGGVVDPEEPGTGGDTGGSEGDAVNIILPSRVMKGPYLSNGLVKNGANSYRVSMFYLPFDTTITMTTEYGNTRTDLGITHLVKYTDGSCETVETTIMEGSSTKNINQTFEVTSGYYGTTWYQNTSPEEIFNDEMVIKSSDITKISEVNLKESATYVEKKYLSESGVISSGSSTNYGIIKFHIPETYNGGVSLFTSTASTRFGNIAKFTDESYSTLDRLIKGKATAQRYYKCEVLEPGYYVASIEDSSDGASIDDWSIVGYKYN